MNALTGLHPAIVTDPDDPEHRGRVQIRLAWLDDQTFEVWARVATLAAGPERGTWFRPQVGDEVVVGFNDNDPSKPYVLGSLWNGRAEPPVPAGAAGTTEMIRTSGGSVIEFDNEPGDEAVRIATAAGQTIRVESAGAEITIDNGAGSVVTVGPGGVTIAASSVTVNASTVSVDAAMLSVDAGMAKFSGVVQADTVIANAVISSSYTPGAGNIW